MLIETYTVEYGLLLNGVKKTCAPCVLLYLGHTDVAVAPSLHIRTSVRKWTTMSRPTWARRSGTHLSTRIRWGMDWGKALSSKSLFYSNKDPLMQSSTTVAGASPNVTMYETLVCFSQIWYAGVWCGQDHHTSCGPKDEPQFPPTHWNRH